MDADSTRFPEPGRFAASVLNRQVALPTRRGLSVAGSRVLAAPAGALTSPAFWLVGNKKAGLTLT